MATDYDTPRKTDDDVDSDSLEELKARRNDKSTSAVDVDEFEAAEGLELPGADLSNEELAVRVLPKQQDEFTCMSCFLVHHRSQLAREKNGQPIAATATEEGSAVTGSTPPWKRRSRRSGADEGPTVGPHGARDDERGSSDQGSASLEPAANRADLPV